ncbi:MAG TPA: amidohydrolase family protein [Kofleriaceae bacterium]|nr:amidohydrolase family protein [Kofleriaceae bacterium]
MLSIIDVHTHSEFRGGTNPANGVVTTLENYLTQRAACGVVAAVSDSAEPSVQHGNLAELRIFHLAVVDSLSFDLDEIEHQLVQQGRVGIKLNLGFVPLYANDPSLLPLYQLAARVDVPVVVHTGDPGWHQAKIKFAHPMTMDEVAVDNPDTRFVLAHAGNPWFETAAVIADKNPNVWLEVSSLVEGDLRTMASERINQLIVKPVSWLTHYLSDPRKLMFGSGWPMVDLAAYLEVMQRAVPAECWSGFFFDNAAGVFALAKR